jgi:PAS domain S-box-containing protein
MMEHHESEASDLPGQSHREELQRLRHRVAELERREAEHRQVTKTSVEDQAQFRLFYEQSPLGYQSLDAEGRILEVNPAWLATLGYEREEVVGRWFGDLLTPEFRQVYPERFAHFKEVGEVRCIQFDMIRGDGRILCIEFDGRASYTAGHVFDRTHCVMRDVTERKEAEKSLRASEDRFRRLIENLPDGVFVHDLQGRIVMVNRAACENTGYSRDELLAMGVGGIDSQDNVEQEWSRFWSSLGTDQTVCLERKHRRKDGTTYPVELHLNRFDLQGQPVIVGIARDVTERQLGEEILRRNEAKYRVLVENLQEGIWQIDQESRTTFVNPRMAEMLGFSVEEMVGRSLFEFMDSEAAEDCRKRIEQRKQGRKQQHEFEFTRKDGSRLQTLLAASPLPAKEGRYTGAQAVVIDITEHRRAEQAVRDSEAKYRRLVETANEGVWAMNAAHETTFVNPRMTAMLGYTEEQMLGHAVEEFMFEEDLPGHRERMRSRRDGQAGQYEHRFRRQDGGEIWTLVSATAVTSPQGQFDGSFAMFTDITDRKRARQALEQSEHRYRTLFEGSPIGIGLAELGGRALAANQAMADLFGYSTEELLQLNVADLYEDPNDRTALIEMIRRDGIVNGHPVRMRHKNGHRVDILISISPIQSEGRSLLQTMCVDVTEHRRLEQDYQTLFREMLTGFALHEIICDAQGRPVDYRFLTVNPAFERLTGLKARDIVGRTVMEVLPDTEAHWIETYGPVALTGVPVFFEDFHEQLGRHFEVTAFQPAPGQFACIFSDITERKRAQEAVESQRAELEAIYENAPVMMCVLESDRRVLYANRAFTEYTGCSQEQLKAGRACGVFGCINARTDPRGCGHGRDCEHCSIRLAMEDTFQTGTSHRDIEYRATLEHNGVRRDVVLLGATALVEASGRSNLLLCLQDISDRKRMEDALHENEERLRLALKATNDVVWDWDVVRDAQRWNPAGTAVFGWKDIVDAPQSANWWVERVHPEDRRRVDEQFSAVVNDPSREHWQDEYRFRKADGGYAQVLDRGYVLRDERGTAVRMIGAMLDITARKRAEERLRTLSDMLDTAPSLITVHDFQGRYLYANRKAFEIHGYSQSEFLALNLHDVNVPESRALIAERMADINAQGEASFEVAHRRKDGSDFPLEVYAKRVAWEGVAALLSISTDITDRKKAQQSLRIAEERLRLALLAGGMGMWDWDLRTGDLHWSQGHATLFGLDPVQFDGRYETFARCIHPEDLPGVAAEIERSRETHTAYQREFRVVWPDGSIHWIRGRGEFHYDVHGQAVRMNGVVMDVTGRILAESALRESEEKFRAVFEQAPDSIVVIDASTGRLVEFNRHAHETLGYTRDEFGRLTVADIEAMESRDEVLAHTAEIVRAGQHDFFTRHRSREGRLLDVEVNSRAISLHDRTLLVSIWTDITERRKAERQVRQATDLLRAIKDTQGLYITGANPRQVYHALLQTLVTMTDSEYGFLDEVLRDPAGHLYKRSLAISDISWDDESRELYQKLAQGDLEFHNLDNLAGAPALTDKLVIANAPSRAPQSRGTPHGHPPIRAFMGVPMHFGGEVIGVAGVANRPGGYDPQIAEFLEPFIATCAGIIHAVRIDGKERQYREALRENHANLLAILEGTEDLIASRDRDGRLVFCNPAFAGMVARLFGVEAKPGLRTMDYLPAEKREYWEQVLSQVVAGKPFHGEFEWDHGGQDVRCYEISFHPIRKGDEIIGTVEVNRDITERKRAQRQAQQRQEELMHISRISTLGEMASGIAHELNQPLTAILSYGGAGLRRAHAESPDIPLIAKYLQEIVSQGERAGQIIQRMRALVKKRQMQFTSARIDEIIHNTVALVRWELTQNEVQLNLEIEESLPPIYADGLQIEQVLLNLIRNGMDAMRRVAGEPRLLTVRAMASGDHYVRVEVCDSGIGLPSAEPDRVFEPFFTTKPDGLGIGLSISRSIIEVHKGTLGVKANPDRGVTFFFTLPLPIPAGRDTM